MRKLPLVLLSCIALTSLEANVTLPRILSDGAVLQRDREIPIRGRADAGEKVSVSLAGNTAETVADKDGKWTVTLPALGAGGPYVLVAKGNNTITVNDVMLGDVWLCSGQSNMELTMDRIKARFADEVASSKDAGVREFTVPDLYDFNGPGDDYPTGSWTSADPESVTHFSAVAYFFARELRAQTGVAIGIVNASLGGAPIEAFMSREALAPYPEKLLAATYWADPEHVKDAEVKNAEVEKSWAETLDKKDAGLAAKPAWNEEAADDSTWSVAPVPGSFRDISANEPGIVWFRKCVDIPSELAGQPARLNLGTIVQADIAYVNGVKVGNTPYQYPPRRYDIPAGLLHTGKNVIAVRVIATAKDGEFVKDKPYEIVFGDRRINLAGPWKFKVGMTTSPKPPTVFVRWMPTGLRNAMIAPLAGMPLKGVVWYQGESNTYEAPLYGALLKGMIEDWRGILGADTPFVIAQLPNLGPSNDGPTEGDWAKMRDEERKALAIPRTSLAVTHDLGEWNDIHPENKLDVGVRLAHAALNVAYGMDIDATGPLPASMTVADGRAVIAFTSKQPLVAVGSAELTQFTIAGADGVFHKAHAKLEGNRVVVWSNVVAAPVTVRYAWADNPAGANLYDAQGLPTTTFEIRAK